MTRGQSANPGLRTEQHQFLAQLLWSRQKELGERAAWYLVKQFSEAAKRYGPVPQEHWREHLAGRIGELAAAVDAAQPEIFANQLAWAKIAFVARQVPVADLEHSLTALWATILPEVDPQDAPLVQVALELARQRLHTGPIEAPSRLTVESRHHRLAAEYLLAILQGDRVRASRVVVGAVSAGQISVPEAYTEIFVPVQRELGRMWHMGEVNVAEEHFSTATTLMVMSQILPLAQAAPSNGRVMLAASVEENTHDLGLRMVADFFELAGWRVVYLGASVPAEDLAMGVKDFQADLVAISAALPVHLRAVEDTIAVLRATCERSSRTGRQVKIIVGGNAFWDAPEVWRLFGADGFARNAVEAVKLGEQLVMR
ncbi:MAG: cobalamin-dependent protein [Planctomycetes bacterium]|nr:cobalamin-dependent protein [Planctomycetota bacterium]